MLLGEFRGHAYDESIMRTQPIAHPARIRHPMVEDEYLLDILEMAPLEFVRIDDPIFTDIPQQRVSKTAKRIDSTFTFAVKLFLQGKLSEGFRALGHADVRNLQGGLSRGTGLEGEQIRQSPANSLRFGVFEAGVFMDERAGV